MKAVKAFFDSMETPAIDALESSGAVTFESEGESVTVELVDVEVVTEDIPGMLVATGDGLTVALDATLTEELKNEGLARELVNRIQNLRKQSGFEVTDRIALHIHASDEFQKALRSYENYVKDEVLADCVEFDEKGENVLEVEGFEISVSIIKK
jgi:isoleucyl-tRNA synthetase